MKITLRDVTIWAFFVFFSSYHCIEQTKTFLNPLKYLASQEFQKLLRKENIFHPYLK